MELPVKKYHTYIALSFAMLFLLTGCKDLENGSPISRDAVSESTVSSNGKERQPEGVDSGVISPVLDVMTSADGSEDLGKWLKENIWDILGNTNLMSVPEVCDLVDPRSARLYIADIDADGEPELIHSLFTGTYTCIESVYKLKDGGLFFSGYYFNGLDQPNCIDGIYSGESGRRFFCTEFVTSGGTGQPYWTSVYEIKFDRSIRLIPVVSAEWAPLTQTGEYCFVKAEFGGEIVHNESEYDRRLSDYLDGCVKVGNIIDPDDHLDVPFSIGFKDITSEEDMQKMIGWICAGMKMNL